MMADNGRLLALKQAFLNFKHRNFSYLGGIGAAAGGKAAGAGVGSGRV